MSECGSNYEAQLGVAPLVLDQPVPEEPRPHLFEGLRPRRGSTSTTDTRWLQLVADRPVASLVMTSDNIPDAMALHCDSTAVTQITICCKLAGRRQVSPAKDLWQP